MKINISSSIGINASASFEFAVVESKNEVDCKNIEITSTTSCLSCNAQLSCLALPVRLVNLYTKATRSGEVLSFPMMGSRHYGEVVNVRSQECWFWT